MKANYSTRPEVVQNQNNGSTLYNYDIVSVVKSDPQTGLDREEWECNQVVIWGEVTKKKIKTAIITSEISSDDEKKLINDYNAFKEGILTNAVYQQNYLLFLERRKVIKEMVDSDDAIITVG